MSVFSGTLAHLDEQDDEQEDEQEEDDTAGTDDQEHGHFGAKEAVRVARGTGLVLIHGV